MKSIYMTQYGSKYLLNASAKEFWYLIVRQEAMKTSKYRMKGSLKIFG